VIATALELGRDHPTVVAWFETYNRLVKHAHINPTVGARAPSAEDVVADFRAITELIYDRLAPYFEVRRDLEALLAVESPGNADVARLRGLLGRPAQRTYFFRRAAPLAWFARLRDAGLLTRPGTPFLETADGRRLWPHWPEGDFIVRTAPVLPAEVAALVRATDPALTPPWFGVPCCRPPSPYRRRTHAIWCRTSGCVGSWRPRRPHRPGRTDRARLSARR
jgi:hypothetical protein